MKAIATAPAASLTRWLAHRQLGLQRRIMLYVALGSVATLAFFGYIAHRSLQASTRIIFAERLHLARLMAGEVVEAVEVAGPSGGLVVRSPERVAAILTLHSASTVRERPLFHLSLLNETGDMLAESHQIPDLNYAEHRRLLADNIARAEPGVVVHQPAAAPEKVHVVAYAPLPGLPGGVTLEQGQDVAMAVPRALQRQMGLTGAFFIFGGLILAWLTTRQVVGPLTKLTAISRSIAAGDLSTPVPQEGRDEVRDLGASFEAMRRQLQESHAELARANQELERRVQERTHELELRHAELARATDLLQQREAERTILLQKTIQAQEEERRRVARELHDVVGQFLSTLVMRLSVLQGQAQPTTPPLAEGLGELRSLTSHAVNEVRRLIVDLRPELLDDMGLPAALGYYAEQVLGKKGITVAIDVDSVDRRLSAQVEVVVFRVIQEAITNILKHAQAHQVRITLQWEQGDLVGTVADDGIGFATAVGGIGKRGTGVGLIGMRERVALLGGILQIRSAPGQGTHLNFRMPVGKEGKT